MRNFPMFVLIGLARLVFINTQARGVDKAGKWKQKLEEINTELEKAIVAGDIDKVYSYYTDDAVSMPNYGPKITGKENLIRQEKEMKKAGTKIHSIDFTTDEVWDCGSMVYEIGHYGISLTLPGTSQPVSDIGDYMSVWQEGSDGSLKMKYEIWNSNLNPWQMDDDEMGASERHEEKNDDDD